MNRVGGLRGMKNLKASYKISTNLGRFLGNDCLESSGLGRNSLGSSSRRSRGQNRNFSSAADSQSGDQKDVVELRKLIERQDSVLKEILNTLHLQVSAGGKGKINDEGLKSKNVSEVKDIKKNPRGFIDFTRKAEPYRSSKVRVRDWNEINILSSKSDKVELKKQAARCMDCGTPFCQTHTGCPIHNLIPEWNDLVLNDQYELAIERLHSTNNFPEFTGRVCPAPCEGSCVAGLVDQKQPVTIKNIEYKIIDTAYKNNWVKVRNVSKRSNKKVAVIGSGPSGLACADLLNQAGHNVTVFERSDRIGGLMYYGIPNMKIDKRQVDRRITLLEKEGIEFKSNANVGVNLDAKQLEKDFDAIALCTGSTIPRKLEVPGNNLNGIYFAMDYLTANQKDLKFHQTEEPHDNDYGRPGFWASAFGPNLISAEGKNVVVIGGGDTGTDCIGTALRQYCKTLINLELLPKNPDLRDELTNPWPLYPKVYKVDYGHEESRTLFGRDPRTYSVATEEIIGDDNGNVKAVKTVMVHKDAQTGKLGKVAGSERFIPAELVILAMGFVGPERPLLDKFGVKVDARGNIDAKYGIYKTNKSKIFAAGDCRRGQSLVVWAINEGRECADSVNRFLKTSN